MSHELKIPGWIGSAAVIGAVTALASLGCASTAPAGHASAAQSRAVQDPIDLRMSELTSLSTSEDDCDENAIPDSVDIALGVAHDLNENKIIDDCESEPVLGSYDEDFVSWAGRAKEADTLALCRVFGPEVGYAIECFVPPTERDAKLLVRSTHGEEVAVISSCLPAGSSLHYWPLRKANGLLAEPDSTYFISLETLRANRRLAARWGRGLKF